MVMKRGPVWSALVSTSVAPEDKSAAASVAELSQTMEARMEQLCAQSQGSSFSTESVVVELTSPDACDLTVVDLPGIIRTVTVRRAMLYCLPSGCVVVFFSCGGS